MKLGAEKKGEVIALVVLLVVAGGLLLRSLAGPGAPPPSPAATSGAAPPGAAVPLAGISQLDPRLHMEALDQLRNRTYSGNGRDLFSLGPTPAQVAATVAAKHAQQAADVARQEAAHPAPPPGPPPPPPIPLKFYGFAQANGMAERVFVQMGDNNFVVTQGETVDHRYLIETISKVSVRVKDLSTQSEQELPLQQGQPTQP